MPNSRSFAGTVLPEATTTQHINITTVINGLANSGQNIWGGADRDPHASPTYKSNNDTAAYFKFMDIECQAMDGDRITEFSDTPDNSKFNDARKYMIVLANILLSQFNEKINIGAERVDYKQLCRNANHDELIPTFRKWAEAIDSSKPDSPDSPAPSDSFVRIYHTAGGIKYPLAMYSSQKLRIYPYNTLNNNALEALYGYDPNAKNLGCFTMAKFKADIERNELAAKQLYAELQLPAANIHAINWVR